MFDKNMYNNYTTDDHRPRRRLSLYESSIWGPTAAERLSLDMRNEKSTGAWHNPGPLNPSLDPGAGQPFSGQPLPGNFHATPNVQTQAYPGPMFHPDFDPHSPSMAPVGPDRFWGQSHFLNQGASLWKDTWTLDQREPLMSGVAPTSVPSNMPLSAVNVSPTVSSVSHISDVSGMPVSGSGAPGTGDSVPALSASFVGVRLNESGRRHSYGEVVRPSSVDDETIAQVHEYFMADPHERVKVTTTYFEQRFFDEEKYLGDLYQLPKFPVEHLLRNHCLVLVAFKAGRIDVFYLPDDEMLQSVGVGDLVIVEADRGRDLGRVVKMNISIDQARLLKLLQHLEQQAALCDHMTVDDLLVKSLHTHHGHHSAPSTLHFPKPILLIAQPSEVAQILNKRQDEEKACRLCLAKIASTTSMLRAGDGQTSMTAADLMQMKLVDAEYQFDRRKLIFYYLTSKRIDFRDLVRELFRIYKTRIWMCAAHGIPYTPSKKPKTRKMKPECQPERRLSYQGDTAPWKRGVNELVPRNYAHDQIDEEARNEALVLKSLVDTLNH